MTRHLTHHDLPAVRALLGLPVFVRESTSLLEPGGAERLWDEDFLAGTSVVARDDAGGVIGCGLVQLVSLADGTCQALVRLAVHPDWRRQGLGSAILEEITERLHSVDAADAANETTAAQALSTAADGARRISLQALFAWLPCDDVAGFAARHGFTGVRYFHRMERGPLSIPDPVWPPGISVRAFDGTDAMFEDWNTAYNEGFAAHFRYTPGTVADCREIAASPGFDPENVLLAYHEGHPVGLVRLACKCIGSRQSGEPELLAVSRPYRGQGLGRALFRAGLLRLEAIGCRQFHLVVDADSLAAPRLYQSEGFTTTQVRRIWERDM